MTCWARASSRSLTETGRFGPPYDALQSWSRLPLIAVIIFATKKNELGALWTPRHHRLSFDCVAREENTLIDKPFRVKLRMRFLEVRGGLLRSPEELGGDVALAEQSDDVLGAHLRLQSVSAGASRTKIRLPENALRFNAQCRTELESARAAAPDPDHALPDHGRVYGGWSTLSALRTRERR